MRLKKRYKGYTTQAAFDWAFKKFEMISLKDMKDFRLKKMNGKKIKVVIKVYEDEE